jgi:hypothetical protein
LIDDHGPVNPLRAKGNRSGRRSIMSVVDKNEVAAAVAARIDPAGWAAEFESVFGLVAPAFARVEPRRRARLFVQALLAPVEARTCWQIAEYAGEPDPGGMQRLLASAARSVGTHYPAVRNLHGTSVR